MADDGDDERGGGAAAEAAFEAALAERERAVDAAIRSAKPGSALPLAVANPPFKSKVAAVKERNSALVQRALLAAGAREDQLAAGLAGLDADGADVLMAYLYKFMGRPENSALLFRVHAALLEKWGMGCIVRAICDRKTVY